jgi:hypothetical protein
MSTNFHQHHLAIRIIRRLYVPQFNNERTVFVVLAYEPLLSNWDAIITVSPPVNLLAIPTGQKQKDMYQVQDCILIFRHKNIAFYKRAYAQGIAEFLHIK